MLTVSQPQAATQDVPFMITGPIDPRMRYLDSNLLRRYRSMLNTDLIHHVASIMADKVLSNGLRMHRAGFKPNSAAHLVYESAWSAFARRVLESWWCFGFAIVSFDPNDEADTTSSSSSSSRAKGMTGDTSDNRNSDGVNKDTSNTHQIEKEDDIGHDRRVMPLVLNPELLRIGVHEDYRGRRTWVCYELDALRGLYGSERMPYEPIPNVRVFEYTPPSVDGIVHSCISRILPIFNQMIIATDADLRAAAANSTPALWTQLRVNDRAPGVDLAGRGPASVRPAAVAPLAPGPAQQASTGTNAGSIMQPLENSVNREAVIQMRVLSGTDVHDGSGGGGGGGGGAVFGGKSAIHVVRLPNGLEGNEFSAAPEPKYLPHFVEKFEQAVANAFKVPISFFSSDKLIRSDRAGHASNVDVETQVFQQSALRLQRLLLHVLNEMSEVMYGDQFREDALLLSVTDPSFVKIATLRPQVTWEFPIPLESATMQSLYLEGTLKREAYVAFQSEHLGIDIECFEAAPGLTLQELHGIQTDDLIGSASAAAAAATKSKRKK